MFGVIEDFMWFTTSLVRSAPSTTQASSSRGALAGTHPTLPHPNTHLFTHKQCVLRQMWQNQFIQHN